MFSAAPQTKQRNQEIKNHNQHSKPNKFVKPETKCGITKPRRTSPSSPSTISDHHQSKHKEPHSAEKSEPKNWKNGDRNLPPTKSFGKTPRKNCLTGKKFVNPPPPKL